MAGPQELVNYTELGFPEVGEIPYSCVWSARGKLLVGDDLATTGVVETIHVQLDQARTVDFWHPGCQPAR